MADEHPNAALFRRGYAAFNAGDMDTIRELFDENITWHNGGRTGSVTTGTASTRRLAFFSS